MSEPDLASPEQCRLQLLWSTSLCADEPLSVAQAALEGGVDLIQVREKGGTTQDVVERSRPLLDLAARFQVPVLINDDVEAAAELVATGVHLGQRDLPVEDARRRLGPDAWIGVSTHGLEELVRAEATSATHYGLGSCFPTRTRPGSRPLARSELAGSLRRASRPVFAIGGITPRNLEALLAIGVRRVAVSSCILQAADPRAVAFDLKQRLLEAAR